MARLEHSGRPQLVYDIQQQADGIDRTEPKNPHMRHSPSSLSLGEKKGGAGVSEVRRYDDDSAIDSDATWRPQWLRPAVLGVFTGLFACLAIAFFVMFSYSQQHDGLFETRESLVYLWRFAPTAVLTIISVLWNRTEVQAMRYMPWIESRHEKSNDWSDLDYLSLLTPQVIVQSLRKKHYLVFLAAVASLLIQAQIVLAPGLFRLIPVSITTPTAIQKLDTFNRTYRVAEDDGDLFTYYAARALNDFDVSYPFGLTKDVAYQTFKPSTGNLRGTINAPINAIVDGFFTDIECLRLQNHSMVSMGPANVSSAGYKMEVALQFEGCQYSVELPYVTATDYKPFYFENWKVDNELKPAEPCPSLPQEHLPFVHYAVRTIPSPLNSSLPVIANASAVLCSSRAWFSEVDITDDGVSPKITVLSNRSSTPFDTDVWALLSNTIPPGIMSWGNSMYGSTYQGPVNAEQSFNDTFISTERDTNDLLYDSVTGMFRRLAPLTGHYILRQDADVGADGQTLHVIQVLTVSHRICLSMAILSLVMCFIAAFTLWRYRQSTRVWHRDPATALGSMLFLHSHSKLASRTPSLDLDKRQKQWSSCNFTPLVLKTTMHITFTILVIGLIAALLSTLRLSQTSDGLATIHGEGEGYQYLLWTSLPALIMIGVSLYAGACNMALRGVSVLRSLSVRPCGSKQLDSSMLDMLGILVIWHSFKYRARTISLSQLTSLFCGLLATLATMLFSVETVTQPTQMQLQQESWFGDTLAGRSFPTVDLAPYMSNRNKLSNLLVQREDVNFTYPKHTFADLAFPIIDQTQLPMESNSRNTTVEIRMPAAKLVPSCERLPDEMYNTTVGRIYTIPVQGINQTTTSISGNRSSICPNGDGFYLMNNLQLTNSTPTKVTYFGQVVRSPENSYNIDKYKCDLPDDPADEMSVADMRKAGIRFLSNTLTRTYWWGAFNHEKNEFDLNTYWRCNFSWGNVMVDVNMVAGADGDMMIDPTIPPRTDDATMKPFDPPFVVPYLEETGESTLGHLLMGYDRDSFNISTGSDNPSSYNIVSDFLGLFKRQGPLLPESLGSSNDQTKVLAALTEKFGFAMAQLASMENRLGVDEDSTTAPFPPEGLPPVNAVVSDIGRRRLVQDPAITYVIVAILCLVVLVQLWFLVSKALRLLGVGDGWLSMDVKGLAPPDYASVSMTASLLHDSNVTNHLPRDTHGLSPSELHVLLAGLRFRLGWFQRASDETRHFTIGVLDDEEFDFLGSKKDMKKDRGASYQRVPFLSRDTSYHSGGS